VPSSVPVGGGRSPLSLGETMNRPHQRIGAISNAHVGAAFEKVALEYFRKTGIALTPNFPLGIGLKEKKQHCFDLGASDPQILVECKSHRWTEGAKVPSAKLSVWNEAMFYFQLAPRGFRKVLFVITRRFFDRLPTSAPASEARAPSSPTLTAH
jgi:hypothetical protein